MEKFIHSVEEDGLMSTYHLSTVIKCSLPDRTPHRNGFIVETTCGKVINIGRDCGHRNIAGLDKLKEYADEIERNVADLNKITHGVAELLEDAKKLDRDVEILDVFRNRIERSLPRLASKMSVLALSKDARDRRVDAEFLREYHDKKGILRKKKQSITGELRGLRLWTLDHPPPLVRDVSTLQQQIQSYLATTTEPEPSRMREYVRQVRLLEGRLKAGETWHREASPFVGQENLWLALAAAEMIPQTSIDKGAIIYFDQERREKMRLGVAGLFKAEIAASEHDS